MIGKPPDELQQLIESVKGFAALSGPFDPTEAFKVVPDRIAHNTQAMISLAAHLGSACDTLFSGDGGTWLMRESERQWELKVLASEGRLEEAIERRREADPDPATTDLLDALTGIGKFARDAIQAAIDSSAPREVLEEIAIALDRAGPVAPAHDRLDVVNAVLLHRDVEARDRVLLQKGFVGRRAELDLIADWLARPSWGPPIQALYISGMPGIGKSTLLEEALRRATAANQDWIVVRLDFDRPGISARDWIGLTLELARQVAGQLEEQAGSLRMARLEAAASVATDATTPGIDRERVPVALASTVGSAIRTSERPLLMVLDTLELLRGRGETHPGRLFEWLDALTRYDIGPISVLAAGRGDALDGAPSRIAARIELLGLDDADADRLLTDLGVPPAMFANIRLIADGSPLSLHLAAKLVIDAGPKALGSALRKRDVNAAYLYRFVLSRIEDQTLRRLANPGLIVRRINAEVISEVLGPQLGLGHIEPAEAERLLTALASHHWLIENDEVPGFVRHRPDMRRVLLKLLYEDSPVKCGRIDLAASAWFGHRTEDWARVESAYHRLQYMRRDPTPPPIDPSVLPEFDEDMILELPLNAQDLVRRGRGERSTKFRGLAPESRSSVDPGAAQELEILIEKGDWKEGGYVYAQTFAVSLFDPRTRDADVARTFLWRAGRWLEARRLLSERDRIRADDRDLIDLPPVLGLSRLEMRAEFGFAKLVDELARPSEVASQAFAWMGSAASSVLSSGALGFAMRRAGFDAPRSSRDADPIGAAFMLYAPDQAQFADSDRVFMAAKDRLRRATVSSDALQPGSGPSTARLLAILTPYAAPADTLVKLRENGKPLAHVERVERGIARLGGLPPSGQVAWDVVAPASTAESLDHLVSLGLFAEWAGAAAFDLNDGDLRLIAASAERWRRTVAGRWSYERPPAGSQAGWARPLDVTIADRVAALESAADPRRESLNQLAAWSGSDDGEQVKARIERRYARALHAVRAAAPAGNAAALAEELLASRLPSAFVPSLAILLTSRTQSKEGHDAGDE